MIIIDKSQQIGNKKLFWNLFIGTHLVVGFKFEMTPRTPFLIELGLLFINVQFSINRY
jgi:hypothetical protein